MKPLFTALIIATLGLGSAAHAAPDAPAAACLMGDKAIKAADRAACEKQGGKWSAAKQKSGAAMPVDPLEKTAIPPDPLDKKAKPVEEPPDPLGKKAMPPDPFGKQDKPGATRTESRAPLDINTATEAELIALKGIGEARAKAIIKGRPYTRKDELVQKGIVPQAVYDEIKEQIIAKQK